MSAATGRAAQSQQMRLRTHLSDRPNTHALHTAEVASPLVALDICGPTRNVSKGFPMLLRDRAFDFSELSLMTYLQARAAGLPLVLLPAVILARFQHNTIWYRAELGTLTPPDLRGLRIGVRSYTVTTVIWARGILQNEHGVDPASVTWVTNEPSHLPGWRDPDNVRRNDLRGRTLEQSLIDGDVDVAILNGPAKDEPRLKPLFADPDAAARDWYRKHQVMPVNHLAVVTAELATERPDIVRELFAMLKRARDIAPAKHLGVDATPFGVEANRRNIDLGIEYAFQQGVIARRLSVDDLFDSTTLTLE